jgi:ferredoxin
MKIKVDEALCEFHGQCVFLAPELFRIEDDKLIYEANADPSHRAKAEKAMKACPQLAISIEDDSDAA